MVTVTFKVNEGSLQQKIRGLRVKVDDQQKEFLHNLAQQLVLQSPVDTGTYITSFEVVTGQGWGGVPTSSRGKPRNQPWGQKAGEGLSKLSAEVESLPELAPMVAFRNNAQHAAAVEYDLGYAPFTVARNIAKQLAQDAFRG